ncbi:hypothetical protein WR25_18355 [Diploscapter pachys]|uniref:Uncharacterized protein n=1 Tax=Diploscapter pachys TaxID=2018661 RepID=A0A2A2JZF5_9BILA|nr:hypothetical protein WR25_18355 [Diploscapter pachys]
MSDLPGPSGSSSSNRVAGAGTDVCIADVWLNLPTHKWLGEIKPKPIVSKQQMPKDLASIFAPFLPAAAPSPAFPSASTPQTPTRSVGNRHVHQLQRNESSDDEIQSPKSSYTKRLRASRHIADTDILRCLKCKGVVLRVIEIGDGQNLLECANYNCLASIKRTDIPAGTIIDRLRNTRFDKGWCGSSASEYMYPKLTEEHIQDKSFGLDLHKARMLSTPHHTEPKLTNEQFNFYTNVPGQTKKALYL